MRLARALVGFVALCGVGCAPSSTGVEPRAADAGPWTDPSPHRAGFATANGVKLHYLDWGGAGENVVLLAGLGNTAHVYDDLAPLLVDAYRVCALTRRGFGESDHPKDGYDEATRVEDLRAALDALGIARAHLAGHSAAGDELSGFAARHPERVGKLVYLDAAYDRADLRGMLTRSLAMKPAPPAPPKPSREDRASVEAYGRYIEASHGARWPEAEIRATQRFDARGRRTGETASQGTAIRIMVGEEHPAYERVAAPALALYAVPASASEAYPWANRSPVARLNAWNWFTGRWMPFVREQKERFSREVAHGVVEDVPGGHFFFLAHPDEVAARIRRFLAEP
jgi:pimeloyl-ACP methyl ester carboxylesterase